MIINGNADDLVLDESRAFKCDCNVVLDTVVEIEDLLTGNECDRLVLAARRQAAKIGWGAEKHEAYKTDDVKLYNLNSSSAIAIYQDKLVEPIKEVISDHFGMPFELLDVDDGFVVRYSREEVDAQTSLKLHRDGSIVSAIVSLSDEREYRGGGTIFNDDDSLYRPPKGGAIVFGGQRLHGGLDLTAGTRYICTLFFKCGECSCREEALDRDTNGAGQLFKFLGID